MLHTSVTGSYQQRNPLANITIAGASGLPSDMSITVAGVPCDPGVVELSYGNGVLHVTGLESVTSGGIWQGNLEVAFTYN